MPPIVEIDITHIDNDGDLQAVIAGWRGKGPQPKLIVTGKRIADLEPGNRALAKLTPVSTGLFAALVIRKLDVEVVRTLGVFRATPEGGRVIPTDKRAKTEFFVPKAGSKGAVDGELVLVEVSPQRRLGLPEAKVVEKVGHIHQPKAFSLISIYENSIPVEFPKAALEQAEAARPTGLGQRTDLRAIPLVTIDGEDARDFDDAVFAEPHEDGWHLLVAIADVAHYVTPGSPLDDSAQERGNSVYFPDRVVPMLPEALSNDLCSLRPNVDRATMAVHMWIDAQGNLKRWQFVRGLMRSAARLTYTQVQAAIEGRLDDATGPLWDPILKNLYGAYQTLRKARAKRGTLELVIPEYKARISEAGKVVAIERRMQQTANQLIEEFMITANVAAARVLENKNMCVYRIHDVPSDEKRAALADFLDSLGHRLPKGQRLTSGGLADILKRFAGKPEESLVSEMMLRSQAQAAYSPTNIGHFGLALEQYAHFTSPIRRYADLLVHRALIKTHHFGDDGLPVHQQEKLAEIAERISNTERRAAQAERNATERYIAAYLSDRTGATFAATISGVTSFGIFVRLQETGADGLIPMRALGEDYFVHDEGAQMLKGKRSGLTYRLGDPLTVMLETAEGITGRLLFSPVLPEGSIKQRKFTDISKKQFKSNDLKRKRTKEGRPERGGKGNKRR